MGERVAVTTLTDRALTVAWSGSDRSTTALADPSTLPGVGSEPRRGAERYDQVVSWDRAGRLYSVWRGGRTARRGLNGRVLQKWHTAGVAARRWLDADETDALVDFAAARAADALRAAPDGATAVVVARAAAFDAAAARRDADAFASLYHDVGILPPDQYLALLVQTTEGCSVGRCEFCDLFARPFRVKSVDEFRAHVAAVRAFMGDSLLLRGRSAFIGAANALTLPVRQLVAYLDVLAAEIGPKPLTGFVDGYAGARKDAADYARLAAGGLRRVYVGLESGHDPLLALVRKPATADETIDAVRAMKAGGVDVGVIVIVGLGGEAFAKAHVADTVAALNRMPLGRGDLVYFSDLVAPPGGRYAELTRGIAALGREALAGQRRAIRQALRFGAPGPRMAVYDIRDFVY